MKSHSIPLPLWSHPKSPNRQWQKNSPSLNILNRQNLIASRWRSSTCNFGLNLRDLVYLRRSRCEGSLCGLFWYEFGPSCWWCGFPPRPVREISGVRGLSSDWVGINPRLVVSTRLVPQRRWSLRMAKNRGVGRAPTGPAAALPSINFQLPLDDAVFQSCLQ